jgi:5-hydroxytryptamine receptor 1
VSPDVGYQVFATVATFYAPTILILILYWKIWQTAKSRIRHRPGKTNNHKIPPSERPSTVTTNLPSKLPMSSTFSGDELSCHTATVETSTESVVGSPNVVDFQEMEQIQASAISCDEESGINPSVGPSDNQLTLPSSQLRASMTSLSSPEKESSPPHTSFQQAPVSTPNNASNRKIKDLQKRKESLEAKRERKAAKTLAVITGAFMACWLPFFVQVLVMALCQVECTLPEYVANAFQWLGYINSTLNPCIYTVFNPEFRQAFKRILFGGAKASRRRH